MSLSSPEKKDLNGEDSKIFSTLGALFIFGAAAFIRDGIIETLDGQAKAEAIERSERTVHDKNILEKEIAALQKKRSPEIVEKCEKSTDVCKKTLPVPNSCKEKDIDTSDVAGSIEKAYQAATFPVKKIADINPCITEGLQFIIDCRKKEKECLEKTD